MQALADAYNTYTEIDRMSDIDRLVELARYTAETWPDREEGDDARLNLGQISLGRGQYDQAIAVVRARSAAARASGSRRRPGWAMPTGPRAGCSSGGATPAPAGSRPRRRSTCCGRRSRPGAMPACRPTDPGLVGNVGDLAIVLTETGKPAEALQLLDPVVKAQTVQSGPAYSRLMEAQLMAFISTNQVQQAIATMKALEQQGGGGASLAQLYFKLGKLLERELDALARRRETRRPMPRCTNRTRHS